MEPQISRITQKINRKGHEDLRKGLGVFSHRLNRLQRKLTAKGAKIFAKNDEEKTKDFIEKTAKSAKNLAKYAEKKKHRLLRISHCRRPRLQSI